MFEKTLKEMKEFNETLKSLIIELKSVAIIGDKPFLTLKEASMLTGLSESKLKKLHSDGKIRSATIGRRRFYSKSSLLSLFIQ